MTAQSLTKRQSGLIFACLIAYSAAYITRTNISVALPAILSSLHLSATQGGWLSTVFALTYAAGQVVSGYLVDRTGARRFLMIGLTGSAVCNLLFSVSSSFGILVALWLFNGIFQSMLWTPIVKIIDENFEGTARSRASFIMSFALILGYIAAWGAAGILVNFVSWRAAFRVPALMTLSLAVVSRFMMGRADSPSAASGANPSAPRNETSLRSLLFTGLPLVMVGCTANGLVRDSIMTWAPKMVLDTLGMDASSTLSIVLIIPCVNFVGIMLGRAFFQKSKARSAFAISVMMGAGSILAGLMCILSGAGAHAILMTGCVALMYGLNPLLTTLLPLEYASTGRVALIAGLVDASIYLGSGASGVFTGFLIDHTGWPGVYVMWATASLIGAMFMGLSLRRRG